jgi:23S rRNA (guanosine2251-2'-O)-methyltransferase
MGALAKAAGGGGLERAPLIGVVNIARAIRRLREAESWCVRLDADAKLPLARALPRVFPVALILGPEGSGLRRLPHEACEALARIPIDGASGSHNLSADVAIALYELARGE